MKYDYTVITYNFGNYEIMHNIKQDVYEATKDRVEYLYITDNKELTSTTWTMIYVEPYDGDVFVPCYKVRFNVFDYAHSDIVIRIDGSMEIIRDLQPIVDCFNEGNYDMAVMIHPTRSTQYEEYLAWVNQRGLKVESANFVLHTMANNGYDVMNYKGLYQFNFMIHRRNDFNLKFMEVTYDTLVKLAIDGEEIHRVDQTVGSFVLNKFFSNKKIMPVGQYICNGLFFNWYKHNSDIVMNCDDRNNIEPFLFNKSCSLVYVWA